MAGLNRMIMTGRLTRDPEIRYTKNEIPVARFTVAVNDIKRKNGNANVNFFNCVAWRGLAGICGEYLKKGKPIAIEGKLQVRQYEKDGEKRYFTEVVASNMQMLDTKFFKESADKKAGDEEEETLDIEDKKEKAKK